MAGLNVSCVPRNPQLLWLQNETGHRSYPLFTMGVDCELKARRGEGGLTRKLSQDVLDGRVTRHIDNAGFGGVLRAPIHQIDHPLMKALAERWRPETNTFHFPIGEATVTLQDVQVIWGLPIDGPAVSGQWFSETANIEYWNDLCLTQLGFIPDDEDHLKGGKIKIKELVNQIGLPFDVQDDTACEQKARTVILAMLASYLFIDPNTYDISLNYLENLEDLSVEGRLSWGAAVIANLYRNLTKAIVPGRKGIDGPLLLLQYWAWERMPRICPLIFEADEDRPYNHSTCLANRYLGSFSHTETPAHVASVYRSFFSALKNEEFEWTPYASFVDTLPEECRDGRDIWSYCGPVIYWNEVEPHLANRVARQFGFIQDIPTDHGLLSPKEHSRLQHTRKGGKGLVSWPRRHARHIEQWNNRHELVFQGARGTQATPQYMQWYHERTVLCVTRPGAAGRPNQYPSWGSEQQLYYEALREVDQRGRQLQEAFPSQSQMFQDFRSIPHEVFEYNQNVDRMNYSSQNIQFASFTQPPPNAFGGFYSPYPNAGRGFFPTPPDNTWGAASSSANPNTSMYTPPNYPLFNAGTSTFAADIQMNQPFNMGGQGRQFTPVPVPHFETPGASHYRTTNLDSDVEDDDEDDDEIPDQPRALQRPRRQNRARPGCGTGSHR